MSQRFSNELREQLPEVDAFIGLDQVKDSARSLTAAATSRARLERASRVANESPSSRAAESRRHRGRLTSRITTRRASASRRRTAPIMKIAEGCNHPCSFCVIPQMRGRHRSRPTGVGARGSALVSRGRREGDQSDQPGHDLLRHGSVGGESRAAAAGRFVARTHALAAVCARFRKCPGEFWVRLLYTHPAHWSDELIETIAQCDKVARYIDMPLQHIDEACSDGCGARRAASTSKI